MKDTKFVSFIGTLRLMEKRLLTTDTLQRMADSSDFSNVLRALSQDSQYDFTGAKTAVDTENLLKKEIEGLYTFGYKITPQPEIIGLVGLKYTYHNAKVAVKSHFFAQRTEKPYISLPEVPTTELEDFLQSLFLKDVEKKPAKNSLKSPPKKTSKESADTSKTTLDPILISAIEAAVEVYKKTGRPEDIATTLDSAYFSHLLSIAKKVRNKFITDYVKLSIDIFNTKTFLRVRSMERNKDFLKKVLVEEANTPPSFFINKFGQNDSLLATYFSNMFKGESVKKGMEAFEKSGNLSILERNLDNLLINHLKKSKYIAFGPEVLFAYILAKENEIRQVRILLTCKNNLISSEETKERLRDNYA